MKIKIIKHPVVCGGSVEAHKYRLALQKLGGRWVNVETDYIFRDQYNTATLRIMDVNVEKIDYEGDILLEIRHKAMRAGLVRCHSYRHNIHQYVDIYGVEFNPIVFLSILPFSGVRIDYTTPIKVCQVLPDVLILCR